MKNGNGKIVLYLVGVIVTLVLFIGFPTLINHVVANEKESQGRDQCLEDKIYVSDKANSVRFEQIMVTQGEFKLEQRYTQQTLCEIKELIKNGS